MLAGSSTSSRSHETENCPSYISSIVSTLQSVKSPGTYAIGGVCSMPLPSISLNNDPDTILGLPLCDAQAKAIIEVASRAPFGRGEDTIVDTSVRCTWQLNPTQFRLGNSEWSMKLQTLLESIKTDMGCDSSKTVSCELYKLLLYEPGGFFKRHRDTEKSTGMFGTLVVQLPSNYTGGQLAVYHRSKSEEFDFDGTGACADFYYAAFYADCQHEIKPVTKGYRLCLIYNLLYEGPGPSPVPADNDQSIATIVSSLRQWNKKGTADQHPMIVYMLEHQYCEASLSFDSLKNGDRAVAEVLTRAREEVNFDMFVANINLNQSWSAWEEPSIDDIYEGELLDETMSANNVTMLDDVSVPNFDIEPDYLVPEDFFSDLEPEEKDFQATGNEGGTLDKQYNWAALLLWPSCLRVNNIGVSSAISFLERYSFDRMDDNEKAKVLIEMKSIVGALGARKNKNTSCKDFVSLLRSIRCFSKVELITECLEAISSSRPSHSDLVGYPSFSNEIVTIGNDFGWSVVTPHLQAIFGKLSASSCKIENYIEFVIKMSSVQKDLSVSLAGSFVSALVNEPDGKPSTYTCYGSFPNSSYSRSKDYIVKLFDCLRVLECDNKLISLVGVICSKPSKYPVQECLAPVCEVLSRTGRFTENEAYKQLVTFCISSLEASSSRTVSLPTNWSQSVKFSCSCSDCVSLKKFLTNPTKHQERFKMAQSRRYHIHQQLNGYGDSVTHVTERVGSPHTLIVTKTRAKYEKACQVLQQEKATLSRLRALTWSLQAPPPEKRLKTE